ncbi:hypothetical protein [Bacillus subtilis]|uniref:hypothetical protein n=1 Tax=Bacillus subtilis TaxID=1423 RepID=UPI0040462C2A
MRKILVTLGSVGIALSLFFSPSGTVLAASNYSEVNLVTAGAGYSSYVDGKHAYGRWTILSRGSEVVGTLYEKCPGSLERQLGDQLKVDGSNSASTNAYLKGGCEYRVLIFAGDGGGKAFLRNTD